MNTLLRISDLRQSYGQSQILQGVSLEVPEGSCTCIMGRNGVGKTTLLQVIMGLLAMDGGAVHLDGQDISHRPTHDRARLGIGYVPQGRGIFPRLSVNDNIRVAVLGRTGKAGPIPDLVFELFPMLTAIRQRLGGQLSGGQQQQLALARALVTLPRLLILDEPTEGIQPNVVADMARLIHSLNRERGLTVLLVEQKLAFAKALAERVYLMERGIMVWDGAMEELNDDLVRQHLHV
jgi:urea transport system ATP-binding protein